MTPSLEWTEVAKNTWTGKDAADTFAAAVVKQADGHWTLMYEVPGVETQLAPGYLKADYAMAEGTYLYRDYLKGELDVTL